VLRANTLDEAIGIVNRNSYDNVTPIFSGSCADA